MHNLVIQVELNDTTTCLMTRFILLYFKIIRITFKIQFKLSDTIISTTSSSRAITVDIINFILLLRIYFRNI